MVSSERVDPFFRPPQAALSTGAFGRKSPKGRDRGDADGAERVCHGRQTPDFGSGAGQHREQSRALAEGDGSPFCQPLLKARSARSFAAGGRLFFGSFLLAEQKK
ncbi:MAG: hypothetical protein FIA97_04120 [Methylococcaceae bacterium]|nr:hypothetical protein [Methylococcaceae bacterium]